jgi:hypothetical protein
VCLYISTHTHLCLQRIFYEVGWTFWNVRLVVGSPLCCVTMFPLQITVLDIMKCEIYIVSLVMTQHGGYLSFWGGCGDPLTSIAVLSWIPKGYNTFTSFIPVFSLVMQAPLCVVALTSGLRRHWYKNCASAREVFQMVLVPGKIIFSSIMHCVPWQCFLCRHWLLVCLHSINLNLLL